MKEIRTVKVKAEGASLFFVLEDATGFRPQRLFSADNLKVTSIPLDYAKSLYNNEITMEWIRKGKLNIIEGKEQLEGSVIEEGYISEPVEVVNREAIVQTLQGSDVTAVKKLLNGENKELVFELALENKNSISHGMLTVIQNEVGTNISND